ncbi:MAG: hypothetical protein ACI4FZ_08840 [Lachnospiraceae bacterium]
MKVNGIRLKIYDRHCEFCGKDFVTDRANRKYCPECSYEVTKAQTKASAKRSRERAKEKKEEERLAEKKPVSESIADVQRKAREAGMSYGKYVLMMGKV